MEITNTQIMYVLIAVSTITIITIVIMIIRSRKNSLDYQIQQIPTQTKTVKTDNKTIKDYEKQIKELNKKLETKEKTKIPTDEKFRELKPYNPIKIRSYTDIKQIKQWLLNRFFPSKTVLINMELLNGMNSQFLVKEKDGGFRYKGSQYVLDNEMKYYNLNAKTYCFDFHEQYSMPIKRKIPLSKIKKTLEASGVSEIEYASNPSTLERFVVSRIAEGIMKGQQLDEWMKQIRLIIFIILIATVIHLFLFMQKTGMLQNLQGKLPF